MHELSIALSIIEGAEEETVRQAEKCLACTWNWGLDPVVVKEALLFSYELACEGTVLEGSKLAVADCVSGTRYGAGARLAAKFAF